MLRSSEAWLDCVADMLRTASTCLPGVQLIAPGKSDVTSLTDLSMPPCPPCSPPPQVIRANETMYKAGQMERVILRKLSEADVEGKRHCIRMLGSFEYRNHLCLVFEAMVRQRRGLLGGLLLVVMLKWVEWAGGRLGG